MITVICFAVVFTVFFKGLYYFDIHYLNIEQYTSLTADQIKHNYDVLIQYQSLFFRGPLVLPDFVMSGSGIKHFAEVKIIFDFIQILLAVGLIVMAPVMIKKYKEKDFIFFKLSALFSVAIPSFIGLLASIDFSKAFVIFHQIVFRNNDWIFDERYDPVIMILPEEFFMHCFMLIVFIVLLSSIIFYSIYRRLLKEYH